MSDYASTWHLRRAYFSPEEVHKREVLGELEAEQSRQAAAARALQPMATPDPGAGGERNVFGGTGDVSHLFTRKPGSREGDLGAQAGAAASAAGGVGAVVGDVVPSIGTGLIHMADASLDLGAHLLGLEEGYRQFTDWAGKHVSVYEPQTLAGQIAAPVAQFGVPFGGAVRLLQMARMSSTLTRVIAAGGIAEGLATRSSDDNLGDSLRGIEDLAPEVAPVLRSILIDSLAKSDSEIAALSSAEPVDPSLEGTTTQPEVSSEEYREAYFNARLKAFASGAILEGAGEGLIAATRMLYRVSRTMMADPDAAARLVSSTGKAAGDLMVPSASGRFGRGESGQIEPFLDHRERARAARALVGASVEQGADIIKQVAAARSRDMMLDQLDRILPPETRRAEGWSPADAGKRYATVTGGRFSDLDLEAPASSIELDDDGVQALWHEAIEFVTRQGYDVDGIVNQIRRGGSAVAPRGAEFWSRSLAQPQRARYWYEISAEGMRDLLPDLSDDEFEAFVDLVAVTSQSTAPTQNMMRALGVFSHTLRTVPSEQDVIDPATTLRALGAANEGLKVHNFGGTFLHHAGLRDTPQLSTNDRQVASSFGMGDKEIAENPVMYGVISRFYQNLRDHLNGDAQVRGAGDSAQPEPWQTWQLQAMGWVQERIDKGNNDFDDYLDVLQRIGAQAREAGLPVGPNGELTREVLSDPRIDPIVATTIEEYRRKMKAGLPITGRGDEYQQSVGMRREFELLGDRNAVRAWDMMERRALRGVMQNRTEKRPGKKDIVRPSPASQLARAVTGFAKDDSMITRTQIGAIDGTAAARTPLPANASPVQLHAWLAVMGQELRQDVVRAGRFRYLDAPPDEIGPGIATSVLYQRAEPLSPDEVQRFQAALGDEWQVDAHTAPNGTVLDVHPVDGAAAAPESLETALSAAGLDAQVGAVAYSRYDGMSLSASEYGRSVRRWRDDLVRREAEGLASRVGGMRAAREIVAGLAELPEDLPGGQALRNRVAAAQRRVAKRLSDMDAARRAVRNSRRGLDADAGKFLKEYGPRLERARARAAKGTDR